MTAGSAQTRRIRALLLAASMLAVLIPISYVDASPIPPTPELWLMDADGSDPREVDTGFYATEFDWAPDGSRFALVSGSALVVVEANTGAETRLTEPPEYPGEIAWAPDGESIIYSFSQDGTSGMRTISPDGSDKQTVLTLRSGLLVSGLDWSPDSRYVSFVRGPGDGRPGRVHILDVAARSSREVTTTDALYTETLWSPDGNWIAFSGWQWHLFVVRPDGAGVHDLTPDLESANDPEWAPDSSEIAFTGYDPSDVHPDPDFSGVMAASPVTGESRPVVQGGSAPSWSPDGTRLAYSWEGDIYTADRAGSDTRRLTDVELQRDSSPDWSPDGGRMAFTRTRVPIYCPGIGYPVEANVIGTNGDDRLEGTSGPDVIAGRGGNDEIVGLGGGDVICGGAGDDEIVGSEAADWVYGEAGADVLDSQGGDDHLDGGDGDDVIRGGEGRDLLMHLWGAAPVTVNLVTEEASGRGRDVLDGIEDVYGTRGRDVLVGNDHPNALYGADPLGDSRADSISGGAGDDHLEGSGGSDDLRGGRGDDHLDGDSGYRVEGRDELRGGPGRDRCYRGERVRSCELRRG